jgi:hypothetical protein
LSTFGLVLLMPTILILAVTNALSKEIHAVPLGGVAGHVFGRASVRTTARAPKRHHSKWASSSYATPRVVTRGAGRPPLSASAVSETECKHLRLVLPNPGESFARDQRAGECRKSDLKPTAPLSAFPSPVT